MNRHILSHFVWQNNAFRLSVAAFCLCWLTPAGSGPLLAQGRAGFGQLEISIVDRDTGQPLACRIHLKNQKGVVQKPLGAPFWGDHFVCDGKILLKLPRGGYTFVIERGPEYVDRHGHFMIDDFADDAKVVDLKRAVDMAADNWWSGDLCLQRPLRQIELFMQADDLHLAELASQVNGKTPTLIGRLPREPVVTFGDHCYLGIFGARAEQGTSLLTFARLGEPLDVVLPAAPANASRAQTIDEAEAAGSGPSPDAPPSSPSQPPAAESPAAQPAQPQKLAWEPFGIPRIEHARAERGAWVNVASPESWELPIWLSASLVDSLVVVPETLLHELPAAASGGRPAAAPARAPAKNQAQGPRDLARYPGPQGVATWAQEVYFHALNCGFRIAPAAASGSGFTPNPVGSNRMYAWVERDQMSYDNWWDAVRQGRVTVTNGPLIRPLADGRVPGERFTPKPGEPIELSLATSLTTRWPIKELEVIRNGQVIESMQMKDWAKEGGRFSPVVFRESGWLLIRVVTESDKTYRYAMNAPWYVEMEPERTRISRQSVRFFLEWLERLAAQPVPAGLSETEQSQRTQTIERSRAFWQDLLTRANAD